MKPHSIAIHPLAGEPDWDQLRVDVQMCRISWPIGVEIVATEPRGISPMQGLLDVAQSKYPIEEQIVVAATKAACFTMICRDPQ